MTLESFIKAVPKADLGLQLEGSIPKQTLLMIADQNEIAGARGFNSVVRQLDDPEYNKLADLHKVLGTWFVYPDDLSRAVYDMGVALSKQNVRYAEIGINPLNFMQSGWTFEQLAEVLNDGRDRARRGWKVQMNWVLNIPRDEPRRSDDITRWALSAAGRKAGVVALGLSGNDNIQPAATFERPFKAVEKKDLPRVVQADGISDGIVDVIDLLHPTRLIGGPNVANSPEALAALVDGEIPFDVCLTRAVRMVRVTGYDDYPLRQLQDAGIDLLLSAGMTTRYRTTLAHEYQVAVEQAGLTVDELETVALNAVRHSLLPGEEKAALLDEFQTAYTAARAEHIEQAAAD